MGNKMISETLGQGFVDSKPSQTEKPCNKIPEEMDSVSVCNLSSKCMTDVNNSHPDVNDVRLAGNLSKWSSRESMVFNGIVAGNSEFNKGCSSDNLTDPKISVLANGNERINKDVPNLGGNSKYYGNVGFEIGKFEDCVKKRDDVSFSPEPSSPTEIEFSGEGINLFVEVFGPLDGISEDKQNLKGEVEDHLLDKNGNIKNSIFKNEGEEEVGDLECTFNVGDLVWAKTQTPLWWPGIISDPSSNKTKSVKKGGLLVKYFGHANLIWCNNLDLKPFMEYYEQLSRQNTSRSFRGSVYKALSEIGRRVKSKMACPCFSKENLTLLDTKDNTNDVLSLSRFDPASFLACVRNFASSACSPGKIELTVVKNRLSSFYRSIGHQDLPMQRLYGRDGSLCEVKVEGCSYVSGGREKSLRDRKKKNPSDYDDLSSTDKVSPSNKGSESRERKRSKFLSYPFVNDGSKEEGNEDEKHGLNSMKKGSKKSMKVHHVVSKADDIDAPSSELLAELLSVVGDPFSIGGSKYSDSLKRFYCSFRSYAFLDADIADKEAWAKQETKGEKNRPKNSIKEATGQKKEIKVVKKESETSSLNLDSINKLAKMDIPGAKGSVSCMSSEKMEGQVMSADLELKNPLAIGINAGHDGSRMISFIQTCPDVCEGKAAPDKKTEPNRPRPPSGDPILGLPDLNKNSPVPAEWAPLRGPSRIPNINDMDQSAFASVTPSKDAVGPTPTQDILRFASDVINAASRFHIGGSALGRAGSVAINTMPGPFARQPPQMKNFFPQMDLGKGEAKEIKVSQFLNWVAPDLDGDSPGPDPLGQTASSTGLNVLSSSDGKQPQKRARKEDPGGSLVLNFSQSSAVPNLETLFSKFSRYGLVKVAEIRALNETTIEIPYERTADVCFAHRSLESGHSFGPGLVSFVLNCPHVKVEKKQRKSPVLTIGLPPKMPARPAVVTPRMPGRPAVEVPRVPAGLGAPLDIAFMKQNVEMMKATLEEMGDKIPAEARARLHNEIRAFLGKIGNMAGGSSSS